MYLAPLMDIFHLKNSELESKISKKRVVLQSDIVKDDPGSHAIFKEPSSFASQMTAANVMDASARYLVHCRR